MRNTSQPALLLFTTNRWPLSARLALAFLKQGCTVSMIAPSGHPLRCVEQIETLFRLSSLSPEFSLLSAIRKSQPHLIIPCDDRATWQLHQLHERKPELRPLIERSLGAPEGYATARSRASLLQLALELGIPVPRTSKIDSEAEIRDWFDRQATPAVLKLDGTWGGEGVSIVHSCEEAIAAFFKMSTPVDLITSCKRLFIDRDPLARQAWREKDLRAITIQEYIPGVPANTMVACWQGEVIAQVSVEVLFAQGTTGAATIVRFVKNEEIARAAQLLAKRLALSGFFGLDFILDRRSATAYLIEMNPRCTQLGHLRLPQRGSLADALYAQLSLKLPPISGDSIDSSVVAFFPQALHSDLTRAYLQCGYHDVPWEEVDLVLELLQKPWPERQWASRIYHWFRPRMEREAVRFPEVIAHRPEIEPSRDDAVTLT